MLPSAPYRHDLAEGPEPARAVWVDTSDGLRLRVGFFETGNRGTVLIFPGRTEAVEKYGRLAIHFAGMGYSSVAIDWRGQGFADRILANPLIGHVDHFHDYQHDVEAVVAAVRAAGMPTPYYLLAHSMGGAIGLRALLRGLDVRAAVFTGPMWGVNLPIWARPVAGLIGSGARVLNLHDRLAPTTGAKPYILATPFEENLLTRARDGLDYMVRQVREEPRIALAGPSIGWVHAAYREARDLARQASPDLPCLTIMGENERVVRQDAIRDRIKAWAGAELIEVPEGEHEVLMEGPEKLEPLLNRMEDFFDQHSPPVRARR
ncbi:alpha/beta fold hydrolase [Tropicimonas sp. S265A]|uniref:alpha/beta fold hydrolase n=1 Tax=Tropicimonas sp. S265A TaxID=3415134 RepID=UPI003C7BD6DB